MPPHNRPTEEIAETAALYALGSLPEIERSEVDRHLAEGCAVCEAEIGRCIETLVLWGSASAAEPPHSLRERLAGRLSERTPQASERSPVLFKHAGLSVIRTTEMKWQRGPLPGVWVKQLYDDPGNEMTTMLVRMDAGATYSSHRHKGVEEVYVLEGELQVEGVALAEGDFCLSQPESVHQPSYSKSGCLLVVKTSKRDEVLR